MSPECPCDTCSRLTNKCFFQSCERRKEWEARLYIYRELTKECRRARLGRVARPTLENRKDEEI